MAVQRDREVVVAVRLNSASEDERHGNKVEGSTLSTDHFSVIIPIYNESGSLPLLIGQIERLLLAGNEVIVVDGGSNDDSFAQLQAALQQQLRSKSQEQSPAPLSRGSASQSDCNTTVKFLSSKRGRALQMNAGAAIARCRYLLFLHADTQLPEEFSASFDSITSLDAEWGRFDVSLSASPATTTCLQRYAFSVISWFMNKRSRLTGIATGDQAIFVKRSVFESIGGYREQPLMEDIELCKQLKQIAPPLSLRAAVFPSARKWQSKGVIATTWLMWRLRAQYFFGASPESIVKQYYQA